MHDLLPPREAHEERVAVVTGGNRGIGLEVCRLLARRGWRVVLGARDAAMGAKAAEAIRAADPDAAVRPCELDVTDERSIDALQGLLATDFGRCDAIVNNAGVCLEGTDAGALHDSFHCNVFGAASVAERLLPLAAGPCAIVNVSSGDGELLWFSSDVQERLQELAAAEAACRRGLEESVLDPMRVWIAEAAAEGPAWAEGVHGETPAYKLSKAALNAYTIALARALRASGSPHVANCVCPGDVRTRMGPPHATVEPWQAAEGVVWAALLAERGVSGGFYRDGETIDW